MFVSLPQLITNTPNPHQVIHPMRVHPQLGQLTRLQIRRTADSAALHPNNALATKNSSHTYAPTSHPTKQALTLRLTSSTALCHQLHL